MKKIMTVTALLLSLAFCACDKNSGAPAPAEETGQHETEAPPTQEITTDSGRGDYFPSVLIGEKYYCVGDASRSIVFNNDGTFAFADAYGASAGDYTEDGETVAIRFRIEEKYEPEFDSYFTVIDSKNLEEMHGEIYSVDAAPASPGNASQIKWQEGSIYKNDEKRAVIEISQVGEKEFWFDIVRLADVKDMDKIYGLNSLSEMGDDIGHDAFIYGWAQIDGENAYFAMFDSYGFSLYEDFDAFDIFAGESTEWAHLRGQYLRIK